MPANLKMRDLIAGNADLVIEDEMPTTLRAFCARVASYEVFLSSEHTPSDIPRARLIGHPGSEYVAYVRRSFQTLKMRQDRLLKLTTENRP